jgi:hypothetical protein
MVSIGAQPHTLFISSVQPQQQSMISKPQARNATVLHRRAILFDLTASVGSSPAPQIRAMRIHLEQDETVQIGLSLPCDQQVHFNCTPDRTLRHPL